MLEVANMQRWKLSLLIYWCCVTFRFQLVTKYPNFLMWNVQGTRIRVIGRWWFSTSRFQSLLERIHIFFLLHSIQFCVSMTLVVIIKYDMMIIMMTMTITMAMTMTTTTMCSEALLVSNSWARRNQLESTHPGFLDLQWMMMMVMIRIKSNNITLSSSTSSLSSSSLSPSSFHKKTWSSQW